MQKFIDFMTSRRQSLSSTTSQVPTTVCNNISGSDDRGFSGMRTGLQNMRTGPIRSESEQFYDYQCHQSERRRHGYAALAVQPRITSNDQYSTAGERIFNDISEAIDPYPTCGESSFFNLSSPKNGPETEPFSGMSRPPPTIKLLSKDKWQAEQKDIFRQRSNTENHLRMSGMRDGAEIGQSFEPMTWQRMNTSHYHGTHSPAPPLSQLRQIRIANDSTGHSYESVFGYLLDHNITHVDIEDPFIQLPHQIYNFLKFCELLVKRASNLQSITLITAKDTRDSDSSKQKMAYQSTGFNVIANSLLKRGIQLRISYSTTMHDREIRFNNGWTAKPGRGLDYFKKTERFEIGSFDYDLRKCHETTIDLFHRDVHRFS